MKKIILYKSTYRFCQMNATLKGFSKGIVALNTNTELNIFQHIIFKKKTD